MDLPQRIFNAFVGRFGIPPEYVARAPGRVNLLGEHVDYNDGFVLPAAIDRFTYVAFRKNESKTSTLIALDLDEESTFDNLSVLNKQDSDGVPLSFWAHYPAGMLWCLNNHGLEAPGMDAVFSSHVPRGAGLSSSASVEMAFGVSWLKLGGWTIPPMQMAKLGLKAEIEYVGVNCGIMDQFASMCGEEDHVLLLDCRSLEWRGLCLPEDTIIVVADTSVRRSLANSAYNERRTSCEEAVRILKGHMPGIRALRDVTLEQFQHYSNTLPGIVKKRAQHIIEEIDRTQRSVEILKKNDAAEFGKLMNDCHNSLRDLYEVSCPQLDIMVALAQALPGCFGARLTGAGFGGCTVNLVSRQGAGDFIGNLSNGYAKMTGIHPEIYLCRPANGARVELMDDSVTISP